MIYHDIIQGSDDWLKLRLGVPTSSQFARIITPSKGKLSEGASKYIAELIGEKRSIYGPERVESYADNHMRHGHDTKEEARRFLAMDMGAEIFNGGFVTTDDGRFGASVDGFIGQPLAHNSGVIELKCPTYTVHTEYLLDGGLPLAYKCQVHGQLAVTGKKWAIFLSYHPGLPPHLVRVEPDAFTEQLKVALELFHGRYVEALRKVERL